MRALLLAAGLGTRLKPLTDFKPKALVEINGRSLLERNLDKLINEGFTDIIINIHHFGEQIIDFINSRKWNANISISDERELLLDTGGAIKYAKGFLQKSKFFLVYNVDMVSDIDLKGFVAKHIDSNDIATLAVTNRDSDRAFIINENNKLIGWRNRKTGERIDARTTQHPKIVSFSGIHVIESSMLDIINEEGVFSIIPTYLQIAKNHSVGVYFHDDKPCHDAGTPEAIAKLEKLLA